MLAATMLVCGLSTGAQAYYLVAFTLILLLAVSFVSALWELVTIRVDMKGLKAQLYADDKRAPKQDLSKIKLAIVSSATYGIYPFYKRIP